MSIYRTLKSKSTSLYKEKGSKFFGYAYPIQQKEDPKFFLEEIKKEHPKARHFCSAFLLGSGNDEYYIVNDDGEPSNSAGAPILGQIRSNKITNVYIVVVRYFGGTKLGVGGLIQAYKQAASDAIFANTIIEVEPQASFNFQVGFELMGEVLSIIDKNNLKAKIENISNGVKIGLQFSQKDQNKTLSLFKHLNLN